MRFCCGIINLISMKKKDVPQHDEGLMEGHKLDLNYAVDEDGNYVTVSSSGWEPKNAAMRQAWDEVHEQVEKTRVQVANGKLSPIAYFMQKSLMDIKILAQYVGMTKRKIRRHLKPKYFKTLDRALLEKYAAVFEISIEELYEFNGENKADE